MAGEVEMTPMNSSSLGNSVSVVLRLGNILSPRHLRQ
jgi:hypothetical protein